MRKSARERLIEAQKQKFTASAMDFDGLLALLVDGDRPPEERRLNPTQRAFVYNTSFYSAYMGPAGCAKTSTLCAKLFARALLEPGTKHLVARQDYNDLMDTTALRMEEMLSRLPPGTLLDRSKNPPMKWWIQPAVAGPGVDTTPSQITFMGLKGDLGSTEYNSVIIDEASEVSEKVVQELGGRMRYGKVKMPGYQYTIDMAFNPPDMSHWLYRACTGKDDKDLQQQPPWITLFRPQPTENVRNLPDGYYERMVSSMPEDMRQRLVDGVWGTTFPGDPVIRQFRRSVHVRTDLQFNPAGTLFRFWDFGYRRPACIWAQLTLNGQLRILREYMGRDIEAEPFIRQVYAQTAEFFPQAERFTDWGDPAVAQHKDTGSALGLLYKAGIRMKFKRTPMDLSLNMLRKQFERTVDGEPAVQIDRKCLILIGALSGGYHFKIHDGAQLPHKDGYYDHLVDALRYGVWGTLGEDTSQYNTIPESIEYRKEDDRL